MRRILGRLVSPVADTTLGRKVIRRLVREVDTRVLLRHPAFDVEWYRTQRRRPLSRRAAITDYLTVGARKGLTPHPLFDPDRYLSAGGERPRYGDVFADYLRHRANWAVPTHPLFDLPHYLSQAPEAMEHKDGPIEHYRAVGAAAGLEPNTWFGGGEAGDLVSWLTDRAREWAQRRALNIADRRSASYDVAAERRLTAELAGVMPTRGEGSDVLVSVIMPVWNRASVVRAAIDSVRGQTLEDWELLVVDDGSTDALKVVMDDYGHDPRIKLVSLPHGGVGRARNAGLRLARGQYVAWLDSDDRYRPEHLRLLVAFIQREGLRAAYDILELRSPTEPVAYRALDGGRPYLEIANHIGQPALVHERTLVDELGEFAEDLPRTVDYDWVLRLAADTRVALAPFVGVVVNNAPDDTTRISRRLPDTWTDVVLARNIIDWDRLDRAAAVPRDLRHVSVIVPTSSDHEMTSVAVESVVAAAGDSELDVEVLIVDNGTGVVVSAVLASLARRFPSVRVVASPRNRGFALGNDIALPFVSGGTVVFLNNDTIAQPGWLEPLVDALHDERVLGAQSLLSYPTGSIQSAGIAFPSRGGIPHALLQGFPVEDADGMADQELAAVTGAVMALRFTDVVALRGFDPLFLNGMEDVDLCLRLAQLRPGGSFRVLPESRVVHLESKTPGRSTYLMQNRELLLDRWGKFGPRDDVDQWGARGFDVVGYEIRLRDERWSHLAAPTPVLAARPRPQVREGVPQLRWAIKHAAPAGPAGESWGDTHFARALARALRALGQHVAVDARDEIDRPSGRFDDVVVTLRGLAPTNPVPSQVSLLWVISHPELLTEDELRRYDRVFAASVAWAERCRDEWDIPVEPLLQATDPGLFSPDRAEPDTGPPVLFVGNSRRTVRAIVNNAIEAGLDLTVYGADWDGLLPAHVLAGTYVPNDELARLYRSAGVLLNDHWPDMRDEGFLSNRLFDAVASGARVVSDDVAGLEQVFGGAVRVASTPEDLRRLVTADLDALFGTDAERTAAAARVAREHSYTARAERLLAAALEVTSQWRDLRSRVAH